MDGTIVREEYFPKLGKLLGLEQEIAEITELGMRGGIRFEESLERRLRLVKDVDFALFEQAAEGLELLLGAEAFARIMADTGYLVTIATGGLSFVAERIASRIGAHHFVANDLLIENNRVLGVRKPIITAHMKRFYAETMCKALNVPMERCIAIGDGANDIELFRSVGLGIALNAKQELKEHAKICIDTEDMLDLLLHIEEQGFLTPPLKR